MTPFPWSEVYLTFCRREWKAFLRIVNKRDVAADAIRMNIKFPKLRWCNRRIILISSKNQWTVLKRSSLFVKNNTNRKNINFLYYTVKMKDSKKLPQCCRRAFCAMENFQSLKLVQWCIFDSIKNFFSSSPSHKCSLHS